MMHETVFYAFRAILCPEKGIFYCRPVFLGYVRDTCNFSVQGLTPLSRITVLAATGRAEWPYLEDTDQIAEYARSDTGSDG
jgi:hypothetical protein